MIYPTPNQLASIYEMLRSFHPYNIWRLPHARYVRFVTEPKKWKYEPRARKLWGMHWYANGRHTVYIAPHKSLGAMVATMAHEMIHVHEHVNNVPYKKLGERYVHTGMFDKIASAVCEELGFNRSRF